MLWKHLFPLALVASAQAASVVMSVYAVETSTSQSVVYVTRTRSATTTTASSSPSGSTATAASNQTTAITSCHYHETIQYCIDGNGVEGSVVGAPTNSADAPASYTSCHAHSATETYCVDADGEEVQFVAETSTAEAESTDESNCHYHAGVRHCTGASAEEETSCEATDTDYDIPLRIGLLFVILVTSALGSLGPLVLKSLLKLSFESIPFVIIKQFGTGVVISTAFVHLITHANLMWDNECMGELAYESTGTALTMAGVFIAFMVEYVAHRFLGWRHATVTPVEKTESGSEEEVKPVVTDVEKAADHHSHGLLLPNDTISVSTMEAGIIFHSILIGITLVVAGDDYFITLFIVILFHQMFEGLALGSRIAQLENTGMIKKAIMAGVFALVTPVGMAIGIGVLSKFNGNDKSTLIALGTLDSFSAGVLIWTGIVEMWAHDWLFGSLAGANLLKTCVALVSLMAGMILMSVLGKWA